MSLRSRLLRVLELLIPPRDTERIAATLTLDTLIQLRSAGRVGLLPYQDPRVRALIWELKYHANRHAAQLAGALLAEELIALASETIGAPLLIPVPMHQKRRRERGYNQTELLCKAAETEVANFVAYTPKVLLRTIYRAPQQGQPKHARLTNAHNTMQVENPALIEGRVCIVVDDVSTTGATLAEAKRALMSAGARGVTCLALAS